MTLYDERDNFEYASQAFLFSRYLEEEVNEDDHYVYNERFGAVAPRITGSISVLASALIIYVIFRSSDGLSSIYHRIMLGMSFADILGSMAVAFTHLPMPMPNMSEVIDSYEFEGTRLGNTQTCTAQGFFFVLGTVGTYVYNGTLCVYYACVIAFTMRESNVKKKVEPFLHLIPLGLGLGIALIPIFYEMYNPTPGSAWCSIRNLEYGCTGDDCERGIEGIYEMVTTIALLFIGVDIFVIIGCLFLVCRKVYKQNKMLALYEERADNSDFVRVLNSRNRTTKIVMVQSLAYIVALFTTLFFPVIMLINPSGEETKGKQLIVRKFHLIFEPLQGFFNLLIFVGSKIVTLRNTHPDMSVCDALAVLFSWRKQRFTDDIIVITGINFVQGEDGNMEPERGNNNEIISYETSRWNSFVSNESASRDMAGVSHLSSNVSSVLVEEEPVVGMKRNIKRKGQQFKKAGKSKSTRADADDTQQDDSFVQNLSDSDAVGGERSSKVVRFREYDEFSTNDESGTIVSNRSRNLSVGFSQLSDTYSIQEAEEIFPTKRFMIRRRGDKMSTLTHNKKSSLNIDSEKSVMEKMEEGEVDYETKIVSSTDYPSAASSSWNSLFSKRTHRSGDEDHNSAVFSSSAEASLVFEEDLSLDSMSKRSVKSNLAQTNKKFVKTDDHSLFSFNTKSTAPSPDVNSPAMLNDGNAEGNVSVSSCSA